MINRFYMFKLPSIIGSCHQQMLVTDKTKIHCQASVKLFVNFVIHPFCGESGRCSLEQSHRYPSISVYIYKIGTKWT